MNKDNEKAALMYLPLLEVPGTGLVTVGPEFELESEACDCAEQLANSGFGRYGGAVPVMSDVWLACDGEREGSGRDELA